MGPPTALLAALLAVIVLACCLFPARKDGFAWQDRVYPGGSPPAVLAFSARDVSYVTGTTAQPQPNLGCALSAPMSMSTFEPSPPPRPSAALAKPALPADASCVYGTASYTCPEL